MIEDEGVTMTIPQGLARIGALAIAILTIAATPAPAQSRPKARSKAKRLPASTFKALACASRSQSSATRLSKKGWRPCSQIAGAICSGRVKAIAGCLASR